MTQERKNGPSCLGLFLKSWLASSLILSAGIAGIVALGIRFFGWSSQAWSDFSGWSSYPVVAMLTVVAVSTLLAFSVSAFIGLAAAFLRRGKPRESRRASRPQARPQSQRKTTI